MKKRLTTNTYFEQRKVKPVTVRYINWSFKEKAIWACLIPNLFLASAD